MTENGNLSAADVAAVVDGRGGYGYGYPVMPMYGGGYGNGFGGFGGDWSWIIILFLFAMMGGWGNGGFGGGNQFPWMLANNTDNLVTSGFNNSGVTSLLGDIQNTLCTGFANTQIADLNRSFAAQTDLDNHLDSLAMSLQNCCCENRANIADLKYTVATEACADRAAVSDGIRDVITSTTANTQRILDQLCQDKIDAKNEKIAELQQQLYMKDLAASQTAQTAAIRAGQVAEIDAMYQRLKDCPVPTMPVYGSQPIFTCPNNNTGCGCGFGGFNGNF